MTPDRRQKILERAIVLYGIESQMRVAQEEAAEMIVAINHNRRGRISLDDLADEVADVCITVSQLCMMIGEARVQEAIDRKLDRLDKRLDDMERDAA